MKEYKIDLSMYKGKIREAISAAIQEKAFEMGYQWDSVGKEVSYKKSPHLFFDEYGIITHLSDEDMPCFEYHRGIELPADVFLSLNTEEPELKPFDRVLMRDYDDEAWTAHLYSHLDENFTYIHRTVGDGGYNQCIPYEGNEHLLGTTGEPE